MKFFSLIVALSILPTIVSAQTPCPSLPACTATINSTAITQITINTGDTICLNASPTSSVEIIFNGAGTLLISSGITITVLDVTTNTSNAQIVNFGTYQSNQSVEVPEMLTIDNCGLISGNMEITVDGKINNYPDGQISIDNEIIAGIDGILRSEEIMCIVGLKGSTKADSQNPMFFSFCYFKGIGNINVEEDLIVDGAFFIDGEVQTNNPLIIRSSETFSEIAFTGLWDLYEYVRLFANIRICAGEVKIQGQGEIQVNVGADLKVQLNVPEPPEPNCSPVLPVELLSFEASITPKNQVQLLWQTASEIDNQGFEIERSTDAVNWEKIGVLEGKGNSFELSDYYFLDESPMSINYYRLKQINFDKSYQYSSIVHAKMNTKTSNGLTIYPNPASHSLTIEGLTITSTAIKILDRNGRIMGVFNSSHPIDISYLENGTYFIIAKNDNRFFTESFIKID